MSKVIYSQKTKEGLLRPFSPENAELLKSFKENQVLKCVVSGTMKARSVEQNAWAHAMFKMVSENTDDPGLDTPEKVKRHVKMQMKFFEDTVIVQDNKVFFELRSFSFDQMPQNEANLVYTQAKIICADILGVGPEELESKAKESINRRQDDEKVQCVRK